MPNARERLVLIGGGHAHLGVLADWARNGLPSRDCVLITPEPCTRYSGMLPGIVAGRYEPDAGLIDLGRLAKRAGCELILDRCSAIDPARRTIHTAGGEDFEFGHCSIDTGGVGDASSIVGEDPRLLDVRPIGSFLDRLDKWHRRSGRPPRHLVVAGDGAGGVELMFALRARFAAKSTDITFVTGEGGILDNSAERARKLVARELRSQKITLFEEDLRLVGDGVFAGGSELQQVDGIIASFGAAAPDWPAIGGLAVDGEGFIAVDRHQRSTSHPDIFAAGDVARRMDREVPHSGVHAVHTGGVLAHNLRVSMGGEGKLRSYTPRPASLYLISTGQGETIATYGPLAAQGRWASRLKHRIDTRWVESFAKMGASV